MHIIDIWLKELRIFAPANLKNLLKNIFINGKVTFRYLFVDWWWLSCIVLFSQFLLYQILVFTASGIVLYTMQQIFLAVKGYYAFLATLAAFSPVFAPEAVRKLNESKSGSYFSSRQSLVWPIVAPFVLWQYISWHVYKFFSLIVGAFVVGATIKVASLLLLISFDWFMSPLFVFFSFIIIETHALHGILQSLEHALSGLLYTYPVSALMLLFLYVLSLVLNYLTTLLGVYDMRLAFLFNPVVILIPSSVVLFGAIYQWHMQIVQEAEQF